MALRPLKIYNLQRLRTFDACTSRRLGGGRERLVRLDVRPVRSAAVRRKHLPLPDPGLRRTTQSASVRKVHLKSFSITARSSCFGCGYIESFLCLVRF